MRVKIFVFFMLRSEVSGERPHPPPRPHGGRPGSFHGGRPRPPPRPHSSESE